MIKLKKIICFQLILMTVGSCAPSLPHLKKTEDDIKAPDSFKHPDGKADKKKTSITPWQNFFHDPHLVTLIEEALKNNQELKVIEQEIKIADNEVMAREGEYIPNLNFKAGYEAEKVGEFTSQGASDSHTEYEEGKRVPEVLHNHRLGLYTSWEIDIWGKLRNASKAAYYRYLVSQEALKLATTRLISEIAVSYYELVALDKRLEIVSSNVDVLRQAKKLVDAQQNAARVTSLAVQRFEAEVLKNEAKLYDLKQESVIVENRINILVGRFPQRVMRENKNFDNLLPAEIATGLPSQLLENRPDVKKAILQVKAAKLDVKAAKARFYPSLSLEAGGGYEAFNKEHLYDVPQSYFYNIGVNLTAPLLNRSAIKADYFSANSEQIQAIYEYEKTLIEAFTEVNNQLSSIHFLKQKIEAKTRQVGALMKSVDISRVLFRAARVDYVEALLTTRESLEAQVELVESKLEQLASVVHLYRSLGGGWM